MAPNVPAVPDSAELLLTVELDGDLNSDTENERFSVHRNIRTVVDGCIGGSKRSHFLGNSDIQTSYSRPVATRG